jgi:hypothetical protein
MRTKLAIIAASLLIVYSAYHNLVLAKHSLQDLGKPADADSLSAFEHRFAAVTEYLIISGLIVSKELNSSGISSADVYPAGKSHI